jgi:hypothetical protein
MPPKELFKLYETDKVQFVKEFLLELGQLTPCEVDGYRWNNESSYCGFDLTEVDCKGGSEGMGNICM